MAAKHFKRTTLLSYKVFRAATDYKLYNTYNHVCISKNHTHTQKFWDVLIIILLKNQSIEKIEALGTFFEKYNGANKKEVN